MNIREVISKHNLFPVVPIVQYKKFPICPWSDESYWIYDKKDCEIKTHKWINKDSQEKTGQITGFSPVSYTHLDVYKRQELILLLALSHQYIQKN